MSDLRIENHGSVTLLRPMSRRGSQWIRQRVEYEAWQWFGGALATEPRLVMPLVEGAHDAGLQVIER